MEYPVYSALVFPIPYSHFRLTLEFSPLIQLLGKHLQLPRQLLAHQPALVQLLDEVGEAGLGSAGQRQQHVYLTAVLHLLDLPAATSAHRDGLTAGAMHYRELKKKQPLFCFLQSHDMPSVFVSSFLMKGTFLFKNILL